MQKDNEGNQDQDKSSDKGNDKDKEPIKVTIDFDNISQRILRFPIRSEKLCGLFSR